MLKDKKSEYVGDFFKNMKHGRGVYTDFISGVKYEGEFFKNKQTGKGIHIYPTGIIRFLKFKKDQIIDFHSKRGQI